jgi:thioredoxin reductase
MGVQQRPGGGDRVWAAYRAGELPELGLVGDAMPPPANAADCDVCIVGAGVSGLSAALILGRCQRRVVMFDSGKPRNFASAGLHGYLSRDGIHPLRLREIGREELRCYPTVTVHDSEVMAARRNEHGYEIRPRHGAAVTARMLLLATGRTDVLPDKPGFREFYGRGVYHCPICDGWENRGEPFAVLGWGNDACELALEMLLWTRQVTLCTDGGGAVGRADRARLRRHGVGVEEAVVEAAIGDSTGRLESLRLAGGNTLACRAVFFDSQPPQKSSLAESLGCSLDQSGAVICKGPAASVPGLFVAGNVRGGLHLAITAAAEGVEAAIAINNALQEQDLA